MKKPRDPKHGPNALGAHPVFKNLVEPGNHYYSKGNSIYLCFMGDGLYQFSVIGSIPRADDKERYADLATVICRALNRVVGVDAP